MSWSISSILGLGSPTLDPDTALKNHADKRLLRTESPRIPMTPELKKLLAQTPEPPAAPSKVKKNMALVSFGISAISTAEYAYEKTSSLVSSVVNSSPTNSTVIPEVVRNAAAGASETVKSAASSAAGAVGDTVQDGKALFGTLGSAIKLIWYGLGYIPGAQVGLAVTGIFAGVMFWRSYRHSCSQQHVNVHVNFPQMSMSGCTTVTSTSDNPKGGKDVNVTTHCPIHPPVSGLAAPQTTPIPAARKVIHLTPAKSKLLRGVTKVLNAIKQHKQLRELAKVMKDKPSQFSTEAKNELGKVLDEFNELEKLKDPYQRKQLHYSLAKANFIIKEAEAELAAAQQKFIDNITTAPK